MGRKNGRNRLGADPDKEISTVKSPEHARQDMEFGESMEADMKRYSLEMAGKAVDASWKNSIRDDGNKNLRAQNIEAGREITANHDLEFVDKMYSPDEKGKDIGKWSKDITKAGMEFGLDYALEVEKRVAQNARGNKEGRRPRSSISPAAAGMNTEFSEDADLKPVNKYEDRT
ncbi:MAG: hypothetical protein ACM3S4_13230 [Burkholderiales bacterium]